MKSLIIAALCAASVPAVAAPQDCASVSGAVEASWICLTGAAAEAKAGQSVLRDAAAWRTFWRKTTQRDDAPVVDFKIEAVAVSFGADAQGRPTFSAVKVASRIDDKAAVFATAAYAGSVQNQAAAGDRVDLMLATLGVERRGDAGSFRSAGNMSGFDGRDWESGSHDSVAARLLRVSLSCTPGVDCPEAPAQRPSSPSCTPGVDCPASPHRHRGCTPGVDCPEDGSGSDSGRTPLPPNYRTRPDQSPSYFPPIGSPSAYDSVVTSDWYPYRNAYGSWEETGGDWSDYGTDSARIERGGSEVGTQGTSYTANLESRADRTVYRVYWRYVGYDCDPNDSNRCLDWRVQYGRFVERRDRRSSGAVVDVRFNDNGQKLLPWEKETLYVSFDGSRVGYDASNGAFRYAVNGPIVNQQTGRASLEFVAGQRVKRQPEADHVIARLEKSAGQLQISVIDRRAAFYEGEPLEIAYKVKKDCGWLCTDKVVSERSAKDPVHVIVQKTNELQAVIPVSTSGSGKYYVVWSFRRAQSKISSDGWVDQGKGPKVQY